MEFRVLGGLEVRHDGEPVDLGSPKQRAVLAVLLLEAGRVVPADRLVELLWGDDAPKAMASLQAYVSNLRRALEPGRRPRDEATVLVTQAPGYRLVVERSAVDAHRYEDLVAEARTDPERAPGLLAEAESLWTGPVLPELADEPFVVDAAARLDAVRVAAAQVGAEARLAAGRHEEAIAPLERAVADHPLHERLAGLLALALYRAGRQADALRVVDACRRSLADVAGLDPGPELRRLEADLLAQAPDLDGPTAAVEPATSDLVGRDGERRALVGALDAARAGRGTAAVVLGEAGIGKTRLVEDLAAIARDRGVVVAWARCPESGAMPPYWPCVEIGDQLLHGGAVTQRLSEAAAEHDHPTSMFALHRAVADGLAATGRPLLLVLDDLQWADADSLRLLEHVAGELARMPVLVVVTTRPLEEGSPAPLVDCLGELTRAAGSVRIALTGLGADAVATWLGRRTDVAVPADVVAVVHDRTGGHPLFVKELSELLAAEGVLDDVAAVRSARAIPPGVQFVVRRRVARLAAPTQQLLSTASVVGRTFDLDVVAAVTGEPLEDVLDALGPALDAGLVVDGDEPGSFRFSHALVADALAAEVNRARRARVHAAVARALERRGAGPAVVAHHALEGVLAGTADLAVDACTRAARLATAHLALEDAAEHWARAVEVLRRGGDAGALVDALVELATACFRAELVRRAKDAVLEAVEVADAAGDHAAVVRAARLLGHVHVWPSEGYGVVDAPAVAALERALALAPSPGDRARLLGALAFELAYTPDVERRRSVAAEAEAAARATGDPDTLARVLVAMVQPQAPAELDRRTAIADEVVALAVDHGLAEELELVGRFHRAGADYERADFGAVATGLARCRTLVDRIGGPTFRSQHLWFEAAMALLAGRSEEAERLGQEGSEVYRRSRSFDAALIDVGRRLNIAADVGGLEDLFEEIAAAGGESPGYAAVWVEFLAWALLEVGRRDDAESALTVFPRPAVLPEDWMQLGAGTIALHVRAELGDAAGAAVLLDQLAPFSGRWAHIGTGATSAGLVDLGLARGHATIGDVDRARALFDAAAAGHERLGAVAWLARGLVHQGAFLLAQGDEVGARAALDRAGALAGRHGLAYVERRLRALQVDAK